MNKIKVSVIGCGSWGTNLIRNFAKIGALDSVCDHDEGRAAKLAEEFACSARTWLQILADDGISGVVIATQAQDHFAFAEAALKAGKHVFVEKPLALTSKDAKVLGSLADKMDRRLMVGHLLQYHPVFMKLKKMVIGGALGNLQYIYSNRLNLGKIYGVKDALWDLAPHDLSMILSLTNSEPVSVQCSRGDYLRAGAADFAVLNLEFAKSIKAHIFVSWLNPIKEQKLVVIGNKAMAVFDDTKPWEQKLSIYHHMLSPNHHHGGFTAERADAEYIEVAQGEPLRNECEHFIEYIRSGKTPLTDVRESLKILKILEQS